MKLTVLKWLGDSMIVFTGRAIEILFRAVLFFIPLGAYMILLQKRSKVSKVSSLLTYTTDRSVWQYVFPGFILVSIEPDDLTNYLKRVHNSLQFWIERNKYLLSLTFMLIIVGLMVFSYIKGGVL